MACPSGYIETVSIVNGRQVIGCTPIISNKPETCSNSEFYRQLTGLPPCDGAEIVGLPSVNPNDPDSLREGIRRMRELTESVQREILRAGGTVDDKVYYPTQTEDKDYPYKVLGQTSRADQKANIFNTAFDPQKRKIIVLMIAGFLLFLALTNAK